MMNDDDGVGGVPGLLRVAVLRVAPQPPPLALLIALVSQRVLRTRGAAF